MCWLPIRVRGCPTSRAFREVGRRTADTGAGFGLARFAVELDPARLTAPADLHLRLHDHGPAELFGGLARLCRRARQPSFRDGNAEGGEQLLALVLEEIHTADCSVAAVSSRR